MPKKNTSKRKKSIIEHMGQAQLKTKKGITPFNPNRILKDEKLIVTALLESFRDNDPEAILEILNAHLAASNRGAFAKKAGIARSTLYDMLNGKKNPTLRVLTQCIHTILS